MDKPPTMPCVLELRVQAENYEKLLKELESIAFQYRARPKSPGSWGCTGGVDRSHSYSYSFNENLTLDEYHEQLREWIHERPSAAG